jgi:hypothetical protein
MVWREKKNLKTAFILSMNLNAIAMIYLLIVLYLLGLKKFWELRSCYWMISDFCIVMLELAMKITSANEVAKQSGCVQIKDELSRND